MSLLRHRMLMGSQFHPLYLNVLARAVGANYILPSYACMVLQNELAKDLINEGIWGNSLDYLHVYADDSGATDMARINWIQPLLGLSTGTPTKVGKKGLYGTINHSFTAPTHYVKMGSSGTAYSSQFAYLTENGGTISTVEHLSALNSENLGAGRQITIRLRTNPRVDYLLNAPTASVQVIYNGFPLDGHFYHIDLGSGVDGITATEYVNGVQTDYLAPTGTGSLPDSGTLKTMNVTSTRAVGLIGGGESIYRYGQTTKPEALYAAVLKYMTAVQLL